jgi:hypothetical protein
VQALAHEPPPRPLCDPNFEPLLEFGAIQPVEEGHQVRLKDPVHLALIDPPVQGAHGVMGAALGPKAMRTLQKVLFLARLS